MFNLSRSFCNPIILTSSHRGLPLKVIIQNHLILFKYKFYVCNKFGQLIVFCHCFFFIAFDFKFVEIQHENSHGNLCRFPQNQPDPGVIGDQARWGCFHCDGSLPGTWRIVPVSKWLITVVHKSPKWGSFPSKWPFHGL